MSRLQSALREAFDLLSIESSTPTVPWSPLMCFLPHPRVGRGDFSSAAALLWGAHSRTSASELALRFVDLLSQRVPGEWYEDNGFIVVKGESQEWWMDELRTVSEVRGLLHGSGSERSLSEKTVSVHVIPPADELPLYAGLRLLALGGVQAFFTTTHGAPCSLSFVGEPPTIVTSPDQIAPLFESAVCEVLRDGTPRRALTNGAFKTIEGKIKVSAPQGPHFLWIAHHTSAAADPAAKSILAQCRSVSGGSVRMPNDGWLISRERAIPEILLEPYLRETLLSIKGVAEWLRVLFHFCSSTPSSLFDPAVARFDELTSPWYSVSELQRRIQGLVPPAHLRSLTELREFVSLENGGGNDDELLALWKSALRLPYRVVAIEQLGEVLEGVAAIEEFCRLGHEYLNRPVLRHNLYKSEISHQESKILAGINLGLSSILS